MIQFSKMHGIGNDFMVVDLVTQQMPLTPRLIQFLAHRNFGVGFDQLLVVEPPSRPDVDFKYRVFNADGSEVEQCGNGARCFAVFVRARGLTRKNILKVETMSGIIELYVFDDGTVRVNMGAPKFAHAQIPVITSSGSSEGQVLSVDLGEAGIVQCRVVNMGNPHAVITVDNVLTAKVQEIGKAVESHAMFPERVNVGFMQVINTKQIRLRVYERGAGETIACGTGACAAAVCGIAQGILSSPVAVQLAGGVLHIQWDKDQDDGAVWMTGPTQTVFEGQIAVEDFLF